MNKNAPCYDVRPIKDLREMLRGAVVEKQEHPAFLTKPVLGKPYVPVSYKDYGSDVDAFGSKLLQLGVVHDTRVAIFAETRYEWYVSYLSVVNGLGVVVPLDKELPVQEVRSMLERAMVSVVIYSPGRRDKILEAAKGLDFVKALVVMDNDVPTAAGVLPAPAGEGLPMEHSWEQIRKDGKELLAGGYRDFLDCEIDPNEMRILLFTSGTTDRSKAVMHSHATISANLMGMCQMIYMGDDIALSVLPLHHTYECTCGFLCQIYRGNTIAQSEGLRYLIDNLRESKSNLLLTVPLMAEAFHKRIWKSIDKKGKRSTVEFALKLTRFLRRFGIDLRKKFFHDIQEGLGGYLDMLIVGGAAVNPQVLQDFTDFGILSVQGYGLTECGPILAVNRDVFYKNESAGLPIPGVEVKVESPDENGIGEFIARGPNIMLGYYGAPDLTAEAMKDGYYHTGDLGYITNENFVIITGRKKNVIVTKNGKNIFPEELEALLTRNPEIAEAVVSGEEEKDGDTRIVVEIFPDMEEVKTALGTQSPTEEEVKALLQTKVNEMNKVVSSYKAIRRVTVRNEPFAKNTTQKIKRDYSKKVAVNNE